MGLSKYEKLLKKREAENKRIRSLYKAIRLLRTGVLNLTRRSKKGGNKLFPVFIANKLALAIAELTSAMEMADEHYWFCNPKIQMGLEEELFPKKGSKLEDLFFEPVKKRPPR